MTDEVTRGQRAEALLQHDLLVEALDALETTYIDAWKAAKHPEQRERLWCLYQGAAGFRAHLTRIVTTGKLKDIELERERKLRSPVDYFREWQSRTRD